MTTLLGTTALFGGALLAATGLYAPMSLVPANEDTVRALLQLAGLGGMLTGLPLTLAKGR